MVVCDFGCVEHFLRLWEFLAVERCGELLISSYSLQDVRTLGIDVIAEIGGIDTGRGGVFLFLKALNQGKGEVGRIAKLLVTLHLERGEVEKTWGCFCSFL